LQGPIHRLRGERFMDIENPNPLFLAQAGCAAHWAENDLILGSLNFQRIPRRELQLVPHRLRQNYATGFVECQSGIHNGILPCHLAFQMAFPKKQSGSAPGYRSAVPHFWRESRKTDRRIASGRIELQRPVSRSAKRSTKTKWRSLSLQVRYPLGSLTPDLEHNSGVYLSRA